MSSVLTLLEHIFFYTQEFTDYKIKNNTSKMSEYRNLIDNLWPQIKSILDTKSEDEKMWFIEQCEEFLRIECGPDLVVDWREHPKPYPMAWAYILSLKITTPSEYKFENFKNGECLTKFTEHPLKEENIQIKYQKMLQAIGYIFNATDGHWQRGYDYMTPEEIEEHERAEREFLGTPYNSDDGKYANYYDDDHKHPDYYDDINDYTDSSDEDNPCWPLF